MLNKRHKRGVLWLWVVAVGALACTDSAIPPPLTSTPIGVPMNVEPGASGSTPASQAATAGVAGVAGAERRPVPSVSTNTGGSGTDVAGTGENAAGQGAAAQGAAAQGAAGQASEGVADVGVAAAVGGQPLTAATQSWWAYERAAEYDVAKSDVMVPMRDGVALACSLSRPAKGAEPAPGTFPGLVVEYTPYAALVDIMIAEAGFFAQRGYNALVCHVRGTGLSEGTWNHAGARQDGVDACDQIEWLATQPFSDGRIGQFGGSYGGFTSYQAAAERPPHLLATAPMISPGSLYHDVIYPGGIKTTERGNIDVWPDTAEPFSLGRISADDEYATNRSHPTFDAYWEERSMHERVADIQVPILTIGAWEDANFRSGTLALIEAGIDKTWAIYGQWPHRSPVALESPCDSCVPEPLPSGVLLAWFDHWVHQLPNVPLPPKPVFISEEGPRGVGQGFRELTWKPAVNPTASYQLGSDNTLALTATATGAVTFQEPAEPTAAGGSLTFTTAPLSSDHILVGHPALHLQATLSAADANLYVELLDVQANGEETLVNDGFLRASHRNSHTTPEPVPPGVAIDYVIAVRADHYRFVAGNSLRIRISGGASMSLVPPEERVEITVATGAPSTLHMPEGW